MNGQAGESTTLNQKHEMRETKFIERCRFLICPASQRSARESGRERLILSINVDNIMSNNDVVIWKLQYLSPGV